MSYAFYKDARDGDTVTLANGVRYQYQKAKKRWMVHSLHDADACPRFDATATKWKDYDNPKEQIIITWFPYGSQDGQLEVGFTDVRLANFKQGLDPNKWWLSIDGNRHEIFEKDMMGGDPIYSMKHQEGDLSHYIDKVVEVHQCEDDE